MNLLGRGPVAEVYAVAGSALKVFPSVSFVVESPFSPGQLSRCLADRSHIL